MTTKEVAVICGVTDECIRQNAKKVGIVFENGKAHDWTEDEVKKVQLVLVANSNNQGNGSDVVKQTSKAALELGALTLAANTSVEATEQLCKLLMAKAQETQQLKLAQEQNQLLLEQKEKAEAETERIYQVNKNFHTNLYTATEIGKKLGISANQVGRIANEHGLKQDPIYGKLGKIQLNNGKWVGQFYYNDEALNVMEAVIG